MVNPVLLLVDANARKDLRLDADFLASIQDSGVLVPIVAVRTAEGALRVRFGHRRTAAAVEVGVPSVPVVVIGDEGSDKAAEVERLVGQWSENTHRTGFTTAEEADLVGQLAAFGVSAAQIAKRTRLPRKQVAAALAVSKDELARAASEKYEFLDLIQAATVAEFSEDAQAVTALIAAAKTGQFEHTAQRLRDARAEQAAKQAAEKPLREAGTLVIERPEYGSRITRLGNLTGEPETAEERKPLTAETHAGCPGHAAFLVETWVRNEQDDAAAGEDGDESEGEVLGRYEWHPMYVCTDPTGNGHHSLVPVYERQERKRVSEMSEEEREAARAERRDVIDSNKAWASAGSVRRDWLRTFLTRKTAPKGTASFMAEALAEDVHLLSDSGVHRLAAELLGLDPGPGFGRCTVLGESIRAAVDGRAQVMALAQIVAGYETHTDKSCWRSPRDHIARCFTFLATHGYTLSPVEERARG